MHLIRLSSKNMLLSKVYMVSLHNRPVKTLTNLGDTLCVNGHILTCRQLVALSLGIDLYIRPPMLVYRGKISNDYMRGGRYKIA